MKIYQFMQLVKKTSRFIVYHMYFTIPFFFVYLIGTQYLLYITSGKIPVGFYHILYGGIILNATVSGLCFTASAALSDKEKKEIYLYAGECTLSSVIDLTLALIFFYTAGELLNLKPENSLRTMIVQIAFFASGISFLRGFLRSLDVFSVLNKFLLQRRQLAPEEYKSSTFYDR